MRRVASGCLCGCRCCHLVGGLHYRGLESWCFSVLQTSSANRRSIWRIMPSNSSFLVPTHVHTRAGSSTRHNPSRGITPPSRYAELNITTEPIQFHCARRHTQTVTHLFLASHPHADSTDPIFSCYYEPKFFISSQLIPRRYSSTVTPNLSQLLKQKGPHKNPERREPLQIGHSTK